MIFARAEVSGVGAAIDDPAKFGEIHEGLEMERTANMVHLEGGTFAMGSESFYPEEQPLRRVRVNPFWIDATPVTVGQFAEFVEATQYVTFAEVPPDPKDYPGMDPALARPGSLVFTPPERPVALNDWSQW